MVPAANSNSTYPHLSLPPSPRPHQSSPLHNASPLSNPFSKVGRKREREQEVLEMMVESGELELGEKKREEP